MSRQQTTQAAMEAGGWVYMGNGTYATPEGAMTLRDPVRTARLQRQWDYYNDLLTEEDKRGQPPVAC